MERRRNRADIGGTAGPVWLWGTHATEAARANKDRKVHQIVATANAARRLALSAADIVDAKELERLLPAGAVHQGVAIHVDPLPGLELSDLIETAPDRLAVLDQISDPQNLGAIFRSAAAFGFEGLILQTRHAPPISGIVAKTAAGAIEHVIECRVVNIARSLEALADAGYVTIGLAGEATETVTNLSKSGTKTAIVLGAEGAGLRPAVRKACTVLGKIPMSPTVESLNVSNAAAIAFHTLAAETYS
ncbi:MAG: RNA methyltransferase [Pseudomonadota bacterium]